MQKSHYDSKNIVSEHVLSKTSRELVLNCPIHGEQIGNSKINGSAVYESFNTSRTKIETRCYKCLETKISIDKNKYNQNLMSATTAADNKYFLHGIITEKLGSFIYRLGFWSFFVTIFWWDWTEAFFTSACTMILGSFIKKIALSINEKYSIYFYSLTRKLKPVENALNIASMSNLEVLKWRVAQQQTLLERMGLSFSKIDSMNGRQFELLVKIILERNNFEKVNLTKNSADNGVDIIAYKFGKRIAIQCKRYSKKVSNSAVQQVYSGKSVYRCSEAYVITNSTFTANAISLAKKHNVKLIDRDGLFDFLNSIVPLENINFVE